MISFREIFVAVYKPLPAHGIKLGAMYNLGFDILYWLANEFILLLSKIIIMFMMLL